MKANGKVQPYTGPLLVDLQHFRPFILDAVKGALRGLRREKNDVQSTIEELRVSIPAYGLELGLAQEMLGRIVTNTERIEEVRAARIALTKMLEVVEETEAYLEDEREGDIGLVVGAVRRVGSRDPGMLVHFERTIRYHGQIALRAARTRRRALEQAKAEAETDTSLMPATLEATATPSATATPAATATPSATATPAVATPPAAPAAPAALAPQPESLCTPAPRCSRVERATAGSAPRVGTPP